LCRIEIVGDQSEGTGFGDHHLCVASVRGQAGNNEIQTVDKVPAQARFACAVLAAKKTNANALPDAPCGNVRTESLDAADYFVARNARKRQSWIIATDCNRVCMANAARFDANQYLTSSRPWNRPLDNGELARLRHCYRFICPCHGISFVA
jgi:hypothetical protein